MSPPNAQYNLAAPESLAMRVALKVRHDMFRMFMSEFHPHESEIGPRHWSHFGSNLRKFKLF